MKCPNCKKTINSGILFAVEGPKYRGKTVDPDTQKYVPLECVTFHRFILFCDRACVEAFFLHRDRLRKEITSFERRLITRRQVLREFQRVLIESDREEEKALVYVLGQNIWR